MATYNLTTGADGKFQFISTEYTTISKTIDFSAVNTATVPPSSAAASSILQVLTLPAGFFCLSVIAEVLTASAAAKTVDVVSALASNVATDTKTWIDNLDTATVANTINVSSFDAGRVLFADPYTMNVVFPASAFPTTGTLTLTVVGFQL
jgi:hypothetical protein